MHKRKIQVVRWMKPNLMHRKCQRSSEKMKQLSKSQALEPRPPQDNIGLKHYIPYWVCSIESNETFIVQICSICLKVCKWKIDGGFCCALLLLLRVLLTYSICACHPCTGAMLIFSVLFQFYQISPKRCQQSRMSRDKV